MLRVSLDGQNALVTGASSGIGRAIAIGLAANGARVAVHYHATEAGALETVAEIKAQGGDAFPIQADVTDWNAVQKLAGQLLEAFSSRLDMLVNNAGALVQRASIVDCPVELWHRIISTNLDSVFYVCKALVPAMIARQQGAIVNVSSIAARVGGGGHSVPYAASKGGVATFTWGLAKELAPDNIRVNGIAPGVIATRFHERYTAPDRLDAMLKTIPMQRAGTAEECVGAVLYLVSDAASYITGEIIEINGGLLMD